MPTPSLPSWAGSKLNGVSCVASADCWARGSAGIRSFLAHWNGSRWSMAR